MMIDRRRLWIWGGLAATAVGLITFQPKQPAQSVAGAVERHSGSVSAPRSASPGARAQVPLQWLEVVPRDALIREVSDKPVDLFAVRSWTPPPPPPIAPPPAPAPVAPPLPFTYLGKKEQDGQWEVYLAQGDQVIAVHQGDDLNGTYQVEAVGPSSMQLRYKPLAQVQTLQIGE